MAGVAGVGSITTESSNSTTSSKALSSMDSADFLNILITQLQQQDPMEPMSNEAMVQQMATIRDMEMSYTLTEALKQMTSEQRYAGAAGLIGKYVEGVVEDSDGDETVLEGVVTSVTFTDGGKAVLELDTGSSLLMENLTTVYGDVSEEPDETPEDVTQATEAKSGQTTKSGRLLGGLATFGMRNADGLNLGVTLG